MPVSGVTPPIPGHPLIIKGWGRKAYHSLLLLSYQATSSQTENAQHHGRSQWLTFLATVPFLPVCSGLLSPHILSAMAEYVQQSQNKLTRSVVCEVTQLFIQHYSNLSCVNPVVHVADAPKLSNSHPSSLRLPLKPKGRCFFRRRFKSKALSCAILTLIRRIED